MATIIASLLELAGLCLLYVGLDDFRPWVAKVVTGLALVVVGFLLGRPRPARPEVEAQ